MKKLFTFVAVLALTTMASARYIGSLDGLLHEDNGAVVIADIQAGAIVNSHGFLVNPDHSLVTSGGGGGTVTWPAAAGIAVCTGTPCTAWGTSYNSGNTIPNNFLGTLAAGSNGLGTGATATIANYAALAGATFGGAVTFGTTTNQIVTGTTTNLTTLNFPASTGAVTLTFPLTTNYVLGAASDTTTTHVLHATAVAGVGAFGAIAAGDLPATLSSGTAITGAALTSPTLGASYLSTTKTASTAGTTANLLACFDGTTGNMINCALSSVGALGISVSTATTGNPVEVATRGVINCVADGATTVGNLLGIGTGTAGRCKDLGQSASTSVSSSLQIVGKALTSSGGAGNAVSVQLYGPGHYGALINVANATGTLPAANMATPYLTRTCEIVIGGTGASNILQTGDDGIAGGSCYNGLGVTQTITGVFCLADTGTTTTVTPIIHGGGTILTGALTCGNNVWSSTGTLSGTPTIAAAASVDGAITAVGTGHSVHIAIVYTVPAS